MSERGPFEHGEYRRLFAWGKRLERESPLLRRWLDAIPGDRVLDLGCGSGEHAAFLAAEGARVVGVDASEAQIESARDHLGAHASLEFVESPFGEMAAHVEGPFHGALCVGNVLPYLEDDELEEALAAWASLLVPGAVLLTQSVNYERLRAREIRHLPVNVRPYGDDGAEVALLRLIRDDDATHMRFYPTTILLPADLDAEPTLHRAKSIRLRAWTAAELRERFARAGFGETELYGSVERDAFVAEDSTDVVLWARRG